MATPYEILGVLENAPDEVIKAAYKALAFKHHPDRNPNDPRAAAKLTEINTAFDLLSDPAKRRYVDEVIAHRRAAQSEEHSSPDRPKDSSGPASTPPQQAPDQDAARASQPAPPARARRPFRTIAKVAGTFLTVVALRSCGAGCVHALFSNQRHAAASSSNEVADLPPFPTPPPPGTAAAPSMPPGVDAVLATVSVDPDSCPAEKWALKLTVQNRSTATLSTARLRLSATEPGSTKDFLAGARGGLISLELPLVAGETFAKCISAPRPLLSRKRADLSIVVEDAQFAGASTPTPVPTQAAGEATRRSEWTDAEVARQADDCTRAFGDAARPKCQCLVQQARRRFGTPREFLAALKDADRDQRILESRDACDHYKWVDTDGTLHIGFDQ